MTEETQKPEEKKTEEKTKLGSLAGEPHGVGEIIGKKESMVDGLGGDPNKHNKDSKDKVNVKKDDKVKQDDSRDDNKKPVVKKDDKVKPDAGKDAQVKVDDNKDSKEKEPKKEQTKIEKKEEAVAYGPNLHISKKHGMYICSFIKNKSIDQAIHDLGEVILMKRAVPFKGEIPHRRGMMSGRYPVKAAKLFINILKGLKGNVLVNQMDLDKTVISEASASWASRPMRSRSRQAKRTNIILKAREVKK